MRKLKIRVKIYVITICAAAAVFCAAAAILYEAADHGVFLLNHPSESVYPIRGIDVSHYQGVIDWPVLSAQEIDFAYIKATEGSSHVDDRFSYNWKEAQKTGLRIGAYHFFSFDSPAESQLKHFVDTVPAYEGMLPPAVDVEFYGDKRKNPPDADTAAKELRTLLEGMSVYYDVRPVIYATQETWRLYIKGRFDEYPLWIRSVLGKPKTDDQDFTLWQYTNREKLEGYQGTEPFIDMNVFSGDEKKWEQWP